MKIQCNACEKAEAKVLCCADEAALCYACDEKVHAANKLAGKHQRVPLTGSASQVPKCDICKEASGYFFCLEDRALLCRKCDFGIHSVNSLVSAHQRFLLTGVKVGTEPCGQMSFDKGKHSPVDKRIESPSKQLYKRSSSMLLSSENHQVISNSVGPNGDLPTSDVSFAVGALSGYAYDWPPEDFSDFGNFNQNFGFFEHGSSKADSGKIVSLNGSPVHSSADEEVDNQFFSQVPEAPWTVADIPSPPTASGLNWPRNAHRQFVEDTVFVPDICYDFPDQQQCMRSSPVVKCRRSY